MPDKQKQPKLVMMVCPACEGTGKAKLGLACSNCTGAGVGILSEGRFYYWSLPLGQAVIALGRLKKKINAIINILAFLVGLGGLAALAFFLFRGEVNLLEAPILSLWRTRHWTLVFFWLSVIADLFLIYRLSENELLKQKIIKLKYGKKANAEIAPGDLSAGEAGWQAIKKLPRANRIDVYTGYSLRTIRLIENSYLLASRLNQDQVSLLHLFLNLLDSGKVRSFFSRLNVNVPALTEKVKNQLITKEKKTEHTELSVEVKEVLILAYLSASNAGQKRVKAIDLVSVTASKDKILTEILYDLEVDGDKMENAVAWFRINERLLDSYREYKMMASFKPSSSMDRAYTAVATPILNSIAYDLTLAAKWFKLEFCVARDREIAKIFSEIESGHSGVILIGESGVGKKTVVHGIAELMVKEEVPELLKDKRLLELDISRLVSGGSASEIQARLLTVLDEIARAGNIALFIDNLETISGISSGSEQSADLSDVLVNALEHRGIFCLAAVTRTNYLKFVERTPLDNTMAKVEIKEPVGNQAIVILESKIGYFESVYKVYFTYSAIEESVKLSGRYLHDQYLPEKAIKILEAVALKKSKLPEIDRLITKEDVAIEVSEKTGIPMTKVSAAEGEELMNLEVKIHERMIDQVEAVDAIAASLRRARAQLSSGKRPIANFLFLGPTGVGKTELAKAVAQVYFGGEQYMIRVDMSEYQTQDSINKMIGGKDSKGYLTEAVRQKPFSLLLLDEFEKAHPDILNLFLQVFDDGRLTDSMGHVVDFQNTIIIATSNANSTFIKEEIEKGSKVEDVAIELKKKLTDYFKPELINRFSDIIVFRDLKPEEIYSITKLLVKDVVGTLRTAQGIDLRVDDSALRKIAELGFSPVFGARPLRQVISEKVRSTLAEKILRREITRGVVLSLAYVNNEFTWSNVEDGINKVQ